MNAAEVIKTVDDRCVNTCTDEEKISYLNEIEAIVQRDLLNRTADQFEKKVDSERMNIELLLERPFDIIYVYYVAAMVCHAMEDWETYNNWLTLYNSRAIDARNYYITKRNPSEGVHLKNFF